MGDDNMDIDEMADFVLDQETDPVNRVFGTTHLLLKILNICKEEARRKLFTVGARTRQGDLSRYLSLRLVSPQFSKAVCTTMRIEFKNIKVDMDDFFLRCNDFTIAKHQRVAAQRRAQMIAGGHRARRFHRDEDMDESGESDSDSDDDFQLLANRLGPDGMMRLQPRDEEQAAGARQGEDPFEEMPSEDRLDVVYLTRFLKWVEQTFRPVVENFKIFDSWSFKPCSLPESWSQRLQSFNSMHPDMDHCSCPQCVETVRSTFNYFGPMSFRMIEEMWKGAQLSYGTVAFTDAFLADIANDYTHTVESKHVFDADRFSVDFGGIRVNELMIPIQTVSQYREDDPKPMPLEVIQLIIRLWGVRNVNFEMLKFMENDYYVTRCQWEETGAFHYAYFSAFNPDNFDVTRHVMIYHENGTLDKDAVDEVMPFFDLRVVSAEASSQMGSDWSLASRMSGEHEIDRFGFEWPFQGRVVFNMFRSTRAVFIESGVNPFPTSVGTANWLKYTIRMMMRYTWGARDSQSPALTGKTAYWIYFMEDVNTTAYRIWHDHMEDLLIANFPRLNIRMHRSEPFDDCSNRRLATYEDTRRPEVMKELLNVFYVSFHDPIRNNTTHMKFIHIQSN